jgi:Flp pilus assembly pilin Flp
MRRRDVVEYALLIATIATVVLIISFFGNNISAWFLTLAGRITTTGT